MKIKNILSTLFTLFLLIAGTELLHSFAFSPQEGNLNKNFQQDTTRRPGKNPRTDTMQKRKNRPSNPSTKHGLDTTPGPNRKPKPTMKNAPEGK